MHQSNCLGAQECQQPSWVMICPTSQQHDHGGIPSSHVSLQGGSCTWWTFLMNYHALNFSLYGRTFKNCFITRQLVLHLNRPELDTCTWYVRLLRLTLRRTESVQRRIPVFTYLKLPQRWMWHIGISGNLPQ